MNTVRYQIWILALLAAPALAMAPPVECGGTVPAAAGMLTYESLRASVLARVREVHPDVTEIRVDVPGALRMGPRHTAIVSALRDGVWKRLGYAHVIFEISDGTLKTNQGVDLDLRGKGILQLMLARILEESPSVTRLSDLFVETNSAVFQLAYLKGVTDVAALRPLVERYEREEAYRESIQRDFVAAIKAADLKDGAQRARLLAAYRATPAGKAYANLGFAGVRSIALVPSFSSVVGIKIETDRSSADDTAVGISHSFP